MVRDRRVAVRVEYLHRALHRPGRLGRFLRPRRGPLRVAGVPDRAAAWMGVRAVLFAIERVHDARVSRASLQPRLRGVPCGRIDSRLHLYKDLGSLVRRADPRDCYWGVHDCRRAGRRDLYRSGADAHSHRRRRDPDGHRARPHRRLCGPPRGRSRELLPHDQAGERSRFSMDRHFLRCADSGHLVLVHRPGDRATRPLGERRRPCPSGDHLCGLSQDPSGIHARPAWIDRVRALS